MKKEKIYKINHIQTLTEKKKKKKIGKKIIKKKIKKENPSLKPTQIISNQRLSINKHHISHVSTLKPQKCTKILHISQ